MGKFKFNEDEFMTKQKKEVTSDIKNNDVAESQVVAEKIIPVAKPAAAEVSVKTRGRKKSEEEGLTKYSLNIPSRLVEKVKAAAAISFDGNVTKYLVSLIEKDQEEKNAFYTKYLEFKNKSNF